MTAHPFLCGTRRCPRCTDMVATRERHAAAHAREAAFVEAVAECSLYSKGATSEEAKAVALQLSLRLASRARRKAPA